ncbi:MAG TPA: DUF2147 domain-containing protein [Myxococcota bacterium]|nr:DUF2147 domain-containing protein [Myxococcota bacterium]
MQMTAARLRRGALRFVLVLAASGAASAGEDAGIAGLWATPGFGSIVELAPCAEAPATVCGRIVWLWEPNDERGRPRVDRNNPDRAARTRALVGTQIASGLRETEPGVWSEGRIYNPDDGRTYTGAIRARGSVLELEGCALRVFCETQTWRRPADVVAAVQRLGR